MLQMIGFYPFLPGTFYFCDLLYIISVHLWILSKWFKTNMVFKLGGLEIRVTLKYKI